MKDALGHGSAAHQGGVDSALAAAQQQALSDRWAASGVQSRIFDDPNRNEMRLDHVAVPMDQQGQGTGSRFMHELTQLADSQGRTMRLTPAQRDPHWGTTSHSRLVGFYKRFGFVQNKGRHTDFTMNSGEMYRKPK